MRDVIDEGNSNSFEVEFFRDGDAVVPDTVHYHLKDATNCRTLIDWTEMDADSSVVVEIDASYNTFYNQCLTQQKNVLTVMANRDLPNQRAKEFPYVIRNLKAIQ